MLPSFFNGIAFNRVAINGTAFQKKISLNNRILLKSVLISKLLNHSFDSCSLINFDFLLPHIAHFYNIIALPLIVFENLKLMFSVFFIFFLAF